MYAVLHSNKEKSSGCNTWSESYYYIFFKNVTFWKYAVTVCLTLHVIQNKRLLVRRAHIQAVNTRNATFPFFIPLADNIRTTIDMLILPLWLVASLLWRHARVGYNSAEGSGVLLQSEYSGVSVSWTLCGAELDKHSTHPPQRCFTGLRTYFGVFGIGTGALVRYSFSSFIYVLSSRRDARSRDLTFSSPVLTAAVDVQRPLCASICGKCLLQCISPESFFFNY